MKRYPLIARLRAPLVVRKERQSQRSEGVDYLSGTLLRGALAQLYLQRHGAADERFARLFLDEERCRFGPLDPAARAFPLTAASCKREGGFSADGKHGVVDLLWLRVARRLLGRELPEPLRLQGLRCHCNQDLKPQTGFWTQDGGRAVGAGKRWRRGAEMHVGIDRLAHSAHESILYALPVMEPRGEGSQLVGVLEADEDEVAALRELLADEGGEVRIGHARTRGHGRVALEIGEAEPEAPADREAWSRELIAFLRKELPELDWLDPQRHFFFSLGLPAGALLVDAVLRYTLDPAGMIAGEWPRLPPAEASQPVFRPGDGFRCVSAVARHERLRGWNAAHGLPRQDEWMVSRGAVYAYLFEGDAAGRQALNARLDTLEQTGLGARRAEGLGRVRVSDDFHRRFHRQEPAA